MRTINSEFKFQIDWEQLRKEERIAPRDLRKVEGYRKPTDRIQVLPDTVGKPWKDAEVTPACAGIVSTCHEAVLLKKKEREEKNGVAERSFK